MNQYREAVENLFLNYKNVVVRATRQGDDFPCLITIAVTPETVLKAIKEAEERQLNFVVRAGSNFFRKEDLT